MKTRICLSGLLLLLFLGQTAKAQFEKGSWVGTAGTKLNLEYFPGSSLNFYLSGGYAIKKNLILGVFSDISIIQYNKEEYISAIFGPSARLYLLKERKLNPYIELSAGYEILSMNSHNRFKLFDDGYDLFSFKGSTGATWFPGKRQLLGIDAKFALEYETIFRKNSNYHDWNPGLSVGLIWKFNKKK